MLYFREVWRSLFFTLLISLLVGPCSAILFNVTVDDSFPDPVTGTSIVYSPATSWFAGGSDCSNCTARLDPNQANRGTWHENAFFPIWEGNIPAEVVSTATFQFQGERPARHIQFQVLIAARLCVICVLHHRPYQLRSRCDCGHDILYRRRCSGRICARADW